MTQIFYPLIYVLAFIAAFLLVQGVAASLFASRDQTQRVNRRLTMLDSGMKPTDVYAALVRKAPSSDGDMSYEAAFNWLSNFQRQAGLSLSTGRFLAIVAGVGGAIWLLLLVLLGARGNGLLVNALMSLFAAGVIASLGAWVWLNQRRTGRLKALEEQMPLALDVINRGMRAGHPVISAVQLAAHEMGDPIGSEFGLVVDETTYGFEFKDALRNFAIRTGSPDAHFFAVAVGIQSQTGGNLGEILAGLATVIRGRVTLAKRVKALASEGRASALLLSALPPLLISILLLLHPTFYTSKFSDPIFWPTVAIVCCVYALGWFLIRRIINIKY
jgi:tight adherence protein B